MIQIGHFSKLSQVSIKTLRHYDKLGLLKPAVVDKFTNYRYYALHQLARINRIVALKSLGLSLEQIAQLLEEELPLEELQGMLRLKRAEIAQSLREQQAKLARVEARLKQIEKEGKMSNYEVAIKQVEPTTVASLREVIAKYNNIGDLFGELYQHAGRHATGGLSGAIWHDSGYKEQDVDAEALIFINKKIPETNRIKIKELPGATMASLIHHGSYQDFSQAYAALLEWIDANQYECTGPNREIYIQGGAAQDDPSYITEIQFPVKLKEAK